MPKYMFSDMKHWLLDGKIWIDYGRRVTCLYSKIIEKYYQNEK